MRAKLLGAVSAAALLGSVSVANAQGPMQLTDTQLDGVTAGSAGVNATVVGGVAFISAFLFHTAASAFAAISGTLTPVGTGPHTLSLSAFAFVP
jgi:hypothetical protein